MSNLSFSGSHMHTAYSALFHCNAVCSTLSLAACKASTYINFVISKIYGGTPISIKPPMLVPLSTQQLIIRSFFKVSETKLTILKMAAVYKKVV